MPSTSSTQERAELSLAEVEAALRALQAVEWARLRKIASILGRTCQVDPDDLLQRALLRVLEGKRRCPNSVPMLTFLAESMRSIGSDWAKARKRRPDLRAVRLESSLSPSSNEPADERPNQEQQLIEQEEATSKSQFAMRVASEIPSLFEDDPQAQAIVNGMMSGVEGEALRAATNLDIKGFASKRRLIRRRIDKAFPDGCTI